MAKNESQDGEKSIIPTKYVDIVEDIFHATLALSLLGIGIVAFFIAENDLLKPSLSFQME